MTLILCAQCGGAPYQQTAPGQFTCTECPHSLTTWDIDLDGDEAWAVSPDGYLIYVLPQPAPTCPTCGSDHIEFTSRQWAVCESCAWGGLEFELIGYTN